MADAPTCPHCGEALRPLHSKKEGIVSWLHGTESNKGCPMAGRSIGVAMLPLWAQKPASLHMEVIDNHPVFNSEGRGDPVDATMVNRIVDYYRGADYATTEAQTGPQGDHQLPDSEGVHT